MLFFPVDKKNLFQNWKSLLFISDQNFIGHYRYWNRRIDLFNWFVWWNKIFTNLLIEKIMIEEKTRNIYWIFSPTDFEILPARANNRKTYFPPLRFTFLFHSYSWFSKLQSEANCWYTKQRELGPELFTKLILVLCFSIILKIFRKFKSVTVKDVGLEVSVKI